MGLGHAARRSHGRTRLSRRDATPTAGHPDAPSTRNTAVTHRAYVSLSAADAAAASAFSWAALAFSSSASAMRFFSRISMAFIICIALAILSRYSLSRPDMFSSKGRVR